MKCMFCEDLSFTHICTNCQNTFLTPSIYKRKILNNIEVISFYKYKDIKELIHTKHTDLGFYIYTILAKNSFTRFCQEFNYPKKIASIAIDDKIDNGYSHTALLNKHLKSDVIKPIFNVLRAKNSISYSGKSKEFRIMNSREFEVNNFQEEDIVLVDDIITTGSTLSQAVQSLRRIKKEVLFCLTLADASEK